MLRIWDTWSQQSEKYRPGETASRWKSFGRARATLGTLIHMANAHGNASVETAEGGPSGDVSTNSKVVAPVELSSMLDRYFHNCETPARVDQRVTELIADKTTLTTLAFAYLHDVTAYTVARRRLEERGAKKRTVNDLDRAVRHAALSLPPPLEQAASTLLVRDVLHNAPVAANAVIPRDWEIGPFGIARRSHRRNDSCRS